MAFLLGLQDCRDRTGLVACSHCASISLCSGIIVFSLCVVFICVARHSRYEMAEDVINFQAVSKNLWKGKSSTNLILLASELIEQEICATGLSCQSIRKDHEKVENRRGV